MLKIFLASARAMAGLCLLVLLLGCGAGSGPVVAVGPPIGITTITLPGATVDVAYNAAIVAANGTPPYTYAVTTGLLPPGFSVSGGGVLAGTASAAGLYSFTVSVTDSKGQRASQALSLTISPDVASLPVWIPGGTLVPGTVGAAYRATIVALNGTAPYSFRVTAGALPAGLSLSDGGVLSGTPAAAGAANFTVTVTDAAAEEASASYSLTIAAAQAPPPSGSPVSITTASLPQGTVGAAYNATMVAAKGMAPYSFSVSAGALPEGLALTAGGVLSGTPTAAGTYSFTVGVRDAAGVEASANFTVTIGTTAQALTLGQTALPVAIAGSGYSAQLEVGGGAAPYTVTVSGGALPAGITLSAAGVIEGTAYATGSYSFTARVVDGSAPQQSASATFSLSVANATVTVDTASVLETVPPTFFGLHTAVYDSSLNDVGRLPALLAGDGITVLRYPGGSYAEQYHWAQNSLTPIYASTAPACGQTNDGYLAAGTDFGSFVRTLEATGTEALVTVNYGSSVANAAGSLTGGSSGVANRCSEPNAPGQPQEAAAWVAYANGSPANTQVIGVDAAGFDWKTVGYWAGLRAAAPLAVDDGYNFLRLGQAAPIGVKYWEIGNEIYYNGWAGNRNFEEDIHAPFIYPNGYGGGTYESRNQLQALSPAAYGANAVAFIEAMKAVDPSILIGVGFASPGATDPIPLNWNPDLAEAVCAGTTFDFAIIHYYPGTYNGVQPGELLSLPESDLPRQIVGIKADLAQYCPENAAAIKFWLTETSPNGSLASGFPGPVVGLFALNDYLTSLENGVQNIDWLELHGGGFLDLQESPGPAYFGLQMAHLLAGVGDAVVAAESSSASVLSFATVKTDGRKGVLLVNADASNAAVVEVTVKGAALGATATEYSYGVATVQNGVALAGTSFAVPGNSFAVTVPPYTAVELLVP